jgi:hypothetical protein
MGPSVIHPSPSLSSADTRGPPVSSPVSPAPRGRRTTYLRRFQVIVAATTDQACMHRMSGSPPFFSFSPHARRPPTPSIPLLRFSLKLASVPLHEFFSSTRVLPTEAHRRLPLRPLTTFCPPTPSETAIAHRI